MAEGWGSITVKPEQHAEGRGVWTNGVWRVAITHPLATESENDARLNPGTETAVAFAVWEGSHQEAGARKMRTGWVPIVVEAKK
jgi:DMSO reductase family type II enzyme heme b subunit